MWLVQALELKNGGGWRLTADSDDGGGFVEGCQHHHATAAEAEACIIARKFLGGVTGFPYKGEEELEKERQKDAIAVVALAKLSPDEREALGFPRE